MKGGQNFPCARLDFGWAGEEETDDCDRVCTGFEYLKYIFAFDSADGDERDFPRCLADAAQSFKTNYRVWFFFRGGRINGAYGYVVNRKARGFRRLLDRVCGETYDGALSQNLARSRRRKVCLSQMHSVSLKRERNVNAVINDETYIARSRDAHGIFSLAVELKRAEMFFSQLNKRRAACAKARDLLGVRES